jgi:hypothetical protein
MKKTTTLRSVPGELMTQQLTTQDLARVTGGANLFGSMLAIGALNAIKPAATKGGATLAQKVAKVATDAAKRVRPGR